jgi:hypothetical protein
MSTWKVASDYPIQRFQRLYKDRNAVTIQLIINPSWHEHADAPYALTLLCACH